MIKKYWRLIIVSLLLILVIFAFPRYQKSENLKKQADQLMARGKTQEAILFYDEAFKAFPLRRSILEDIEGAKIVLKSDLEYGQIEEIYAEIQNVPPVLVVPPPPLILKKGEFFIPILMYHHIRINPRPDNRAWAILNVSPAQLESQFQYLTTHNFHVISLDELFRVLTNGNSLPENPVVLTFDDGYRNFYENAFPLLKKYNLKAIEFIITNTPMLSDTGAYLSWNEIKEMDKSGLVEFGSHTRHHPNLPDLSPSLIVNEIKESKAELEAHLGKPVKWFAYPYGSYNNTAIQAVRDAGYNGAVSTIYGAAQSSDKLFLLPRIGVDGRLGLDNFIQIIQYKK